MDMAPVIFYGMVFLVTMEMATLFMGVCLLGHRAEVLLDLQEELFLLMD
jgi:hypothetical protein